MAKTDAVILPSNVHPENYALTMTPDFHDFTFTGHEVIAIDVLKPKRG